jgi:hypothetical protein
MRRVLVFLATIALFGTGLELDAAAAPLTCGSVVQQSQKLTHDIVNCGISPALAFGANGVTLDLDGHVVDGVGVGTGIRSAGFANSTVKNGRIRGFSTAVSFGGGQLPKATALRITEVVTGVWLESPSKSALVSGNRIAATALGVFVDGAELNTVRGNVIAGSGTAILLENAATYTLVQGNRISGPSIGVNVFDASASRVIANVIRGGSTPIAVVGPSSQASLLSNDIANATADGIRVGAGATGVAIGRNTSRGNVGDGIFVDSTDPGVSVGDNIANGNGSFGIEVQPATDDAGGNRARDNVEFAQCENVICL